MQDALIKPNLSSPDAPMSRDSDRGQFGLPVCPTGHFVLTTTKTIIFGLVIHFQFYEAFCHKCQKRYIVHRYRLDWKKNWKIYKHKILKRPPAEAMDKIASEELAARGCRKPTIDEVRQWALS